MQNEAKEAFEKFIRTLRESGDVFGSSVLLEDSASGSKIPKSHLNKIAKWTRTEQNPEKLHTYPVLMIDTEPTRNMVMYTETSQKKSVKRWPGTTYLFNHKGGAGGSWFQADHTLQAASQIARIYDAQFVSTPRGTKGTLGWFYAVEGIDDITDSFIRKLDAGILREVSIHVSVPDGVICSICKDSFSKCNEKSGTWHYPGDKYGKEVCYMSTGEGILIPLELSSVACPGSVNAHVMHDDEVEDYPTVSLREALGGSLDVRKTITKEIDMKKTPDEIAAELKKVQEMAAAAGVSLSEVGERAGLTLEERVPGTEAKKCESCGHGVHEGKACGVQSCECGKNSKGDGDGDDPPSDKGENNPNPTNSLFEGDCVVCGRSAEAGNGGAINETETIKKVRKEYQAQVQDIVNRAKVKVDAAEARATAAEARVSQFNAFFKDFCAETADMAINAGVKQESERDTYVKSLQALTYEAVREIRSAFAGKARTESNTTTRLTQKMSERYQQNLGATVIDTQEDGTKKSSTDRRPRFAAV